MSPDLMSGGSLQPLEDIRRMTELIAFCTALSTMFLSGLLFYRLTRGR